MKSLKLQSLKVLVVTLMFAIGFSHFAAAADDGRGSLGLNMWDFKPVTDKRLLDLNDEGLKRVQGLDFSASPELSSLAIELSTPILEMTEDVYKDGNKYP